MAVVAALGRTAGVLRPSRNVPILLFVPLGLVAVTVGAYAGRTNTHKAAAPARTSPAPTTAPAAKPAGESATAPTATSTDSQPAWPARSRITAETNPAAYLVAVRTGRHTTFDRVVFEFRGPVPGYAIQYVEQVTQGASGRPVPLRGRAFLHVVFRHASEMEQLPSSSPPDRMTYAGPSTITPGLGSMLQVQAAGDFEGHLSFGIGLGDRAGFRVLSLANPSRVAIDAARVPLPAFPGIWDVRTWEQAWQVQDAVDDGHQPRRTSPTDSVMPYAIDVLGVARPTVRLVDPHTVEVSKPGAGVVATVQLTQPVTRGSGGIWVITRVDRAR